VTFLLLALALAFAWSMGAHYTGACMGMPHALRAVKAWQALLIMAPCVWLGATVASHAVEHTVAFRLTARPLETGAEVIVIGVAFALTTVFTQRRVPTSTIQILVFAVAGAALGDGVGVSWAVIGLLAVVWVLAPVVAAALGFAFTKVLDRVPAAGGNAHSPGEGGSFALHDSGRLLATGLVTVGAAASFVMGSNDVANATGSLVGALDFSPLWAGFIGGGALALGVLTWGRPLLERVAFDIVKVDTRMATAAQGVQAIVVITAVAFGFFTSMNQALVGAMAGTGAARGKETVDMRVLAGIMRGWIIGPGAAIAVAYLVTRAVIALAGHAALA
jgi:PiT family inorganic phosphate transporter